MRPLLVLRGSTLAALSESSGARSVFVPMLEHAQAFPGLYRRVESPVECAGQGPLRIGRREIRARHYRYLDKAASYWVDEHGIVLKARQQLPGAANLWSSSAIMPRGGIHTDGRLP